jgi:hypothetical protein
VRRELVDHDPAQRHGADAAARLGQDEALGPAVPLALHPQRRSKEVHVPDPQPERLGDPQARSSEQDDQRPLSGMDALGERGDLSRGRWLDLDARP